MNAAKGSSTSNPGTLGYACAHRGDHCLIYVDMIAIPGPGEDSVADPQSLLGPEGEAFLSLSNIVKTKSEWPHSSAPKSKRVRCGVKSLQYTTLLERLLQAGMITLRNSCDEVVENSIFEVWKTGGVSQCLIWAGNRSNLLFREEVSRVELPTPDLVASILVEEGEYFYLAGCDLSQ